MILDKNKHDTHDTIFVGKPTTDNGTVKFCFDCNEYYGKGYNYDASN